MQYQTYQTSACNFLSYLLRFLAKSLLINPIVKIEQKRKEKMLLFRAFFLKKWYIGKFEKLDLGKKLQSSFLHSSEQPENLCTRLLENYEFLPVSSFFRYWAKKCGRFFFKVQNNFQIPISISFFLLFFRQKYDSKITSRR